MSQILRYSRDLTEHLPCLEWLSIKPQASVSAPLCFYFALSLAIITFSCNLSSPCSLWFASAVSCHSPTHISEHSSPPALHTDVFYKDAPVPPTQDLSVSLSLLANRRAPGRKMAKYHTFPHSPGLHRKQPQQWLATKDLSWD